MAAENKIRHGSTIVDFDSSLKQEEACIVQVPSCNRRLWWTNRSDSTAWPYATLARPSHPQKPRAA